MNNWLKLLLEIEFIAAAFSVPAACIHCAAGDDRWRQFHYHFLRFFGMGNGFLLTVTAILEFGRRTSRW
jgi:hypothetical protein